MHKNTKKQLQPLKKKEAKETSHAGNRTRIGRVRACYPNQLDYMGPVFDSYLTYLTPWMSVARSIPTLFEFLSFGIHSLLYKDPQTYSFLYPILVIMRQNPQAHLLTYRRRHFIHSLAISSFFHTPYMQQTQNMLNISSTDSLMSDGFTVYTSPQFLFSTPQRTPSPTPFEQNVLPSNCFR